MKISFACGKCATVLEADALATGQAVACPKCGTVLKVPTVRPGPGVTIGGFRIKKLIAVGGMGEVYLAEQLSLGRDVALKILPPHFKSDKETVAKFLTEVRTAAKLQHPNLVTVYEAGEDHGIYFLAMAYIDGETLDERLSKKGAMPEADALEIALEVGGALSAAWDSHKLIHCDVKPGNVMLDRNDKPHLMDMGLSKLLSECSTTSGAEAFGTPNYVSPEQSFNAPNLDFRSDMFSLGMTLYHMVTGKLPFDAPTPSETLHKLDNETLPDPRTIVSGITPGCAVLLERMLGRKPASRYENWESLLKDITRVRKGGKPMRGALPPGESVLARTTGTSAPTGSLSKMRAPQAAAPPKPKTAGDPIQGLVVLIALIAVLGAGGYVFRHRLKKLMDGTTSAQPVLPGAETNAPPVAPQEMPTVPLPVQDEKDAALRKLFDEALHFEQKHPGEFVAVRTRYEAVQTRGAGTVWADKAAIELERVGATRKTALDEMRKRLRAEVDQLVADGQVDKAIEVLRGYKGPFTKTTQEERLEMANQLQAQKDKTRDNGALLKPFLVGVADDLLRMDFTGLKHRFGAADTNAVIVASAEYKPIREMALKMTAMPDAVLDSFKRDIGKTVSVSTRTGADKGEVAAVVGDRVQLKKVLAIGGQDSGFAMVEYRASDLTVQEWLLRLTEKSAEQELMRGLLTCQIKAYDKARALFQQADHPLGGLLVERIVELQAAAIAREKATAEAAAQSAYNVLLQAAVPGLAKQDSDSLSVAIRRNKVTDTERTKVLALLQAYRGQYGKSDWANAHQEVLSALAEIGTKVGKNIVRIDPDAFDRAMAKLQEDNPGDPIRSKASLEEDGIVLSLRGNLSLKDLAALTGLPIKQLDLSGCAKLKNLNPLEGMPLEAIYLDGTIVENLRVLRGAPLQEITLRGCKELRGVRALSDLPLRHVDVTDCPAELDLTPISKIPGIKIDK